MRTIVHLSDLHFGRTNSLLLEPLLLAVQASLPDCVVVSGDLTQRARASEFRQARAYLDLLPGPQIVVPGNHDVPLYRFWERWFNPLGNYRRYIDADIETAFIDSEIAVFGVNTARALTFKGGRINTDQLEALRRKIAPLPPAVTKIIVTHHPFDVPNTREADDLVGRARQAMASFARSDVDLLLAGHLHTTHAGDTAGRYDLDGYAALVVQAGTATSTRGRGEANSFNVLRIEPGVVAVERHHWQDRNGAFALENTERFRNEGGGWLRVVEE